jgi:hypothetical protein
LFDNIETSEFYNLEVSFFNFDMKNLLICVIVLLANVCLAQTDTLKAAQAKEYIGKEIIVKDIIAGARLFDKPDKKTFLINLAERYPNTPLTVVLYDEAYLKLEPKADIEGKTITVKGLVTLFNEKIQIVISDLKNIKIQ